MKKQAERRRYFRINDTVGIAYQQIKNSRASIGRKHKVPDILQLFAEQDAKMQRLLVELKSSQPEVSELITLINQKLERVVNHMMVESKLTSRIAEKVQEVNISACGIAFHDEEQVAVNSALQLEITLYPSYHKIETEGRVVSCEEVENAQGYYIRIDFYAMSETHQERLIQHIVRAQSQQIKSLRK